MSSTENFFANNVAISEKYFRQNMAKLSYQRKSIRDIEIKHKEWSKIIQDH